MSSKRRQRRSMCNGKTRHKTAEGANIQRRELNTPGLDVYKCPFCKGYHVGRRSKKRWAAYNAAKGNR